MDKILVVLAFLLWSGPAVAGYASHSLEFNGAERGVYVHVPENLAGKADLPVVLVLHGGGGNALGMRDMTGMDSVADKNGFIAVYPEGNASPFIGRLRTWNGGACCGYAAKKNLDDVGFISAVIDFLIKEYKIDANRVYATGHSNGGQMSYRLACDLSGRIAAIAPNGGQRVLDHCKPKRPVPVMHIHGTKDPCALYDGGEACGGCFAQVFGIGDKDKWPCKPVRSIVKEHAQLNGCEDVTEIALQKGAVTCERFTCPKNAVVGLCSIEGAGHVWAGKHDRGPAVCKKEPERKICTKYAQAVGPAYRDIDAGELAWDFLRHFSLKGEVE